MQTTFGTYGHLFPDDREAIREALEDAWRVGEEAPELNISGADAYKMRTRRPKAEAAEG